MIKQSHAENTAFFDFLPVLCKLRDLRRNNKRNVKKLFFARKVLFRILCKLITFVAHFRCYVSRELSLRKEGFSQGERLSFTEFHLWSVDSDLTVIQNFLDRCFKRKYTSKRMDIRELLEKADKNLFKIRSVDPDCQLSNILPKKKETRYQLRNKSAHRPDIKTGTFKNVFRHVNARILRLVYSPENSYGPNFTSTNYKSASSLVDIKSRWFQQTYMYLSTLFFVRRSFKTTFEDNSTSHAMYFHCTPLKVDCADDTHKR
ncbi:unnamed protein product [Porites lobata]|uniref:Maturase K n=1 Tax=Porites lobata TaxID=104759 RepID=A0ABN8PB47_9CNID|nr:unnamed protein product [Porites lobata]